MPNNETDALAFIYNRKSVRHYTAEKVSREQLEILIKAGMAAPTGKNLQPWEFVIITDENKLKELSRGLPCAKMLQHVPAAIVVCGNLKESSSKPFEHYWALDCSVASENILLAAEALGLGAVWTAAFPYKEKMKIVSELLNLPEHIVPLNVIPVGHPSNIEHPKDKFKPEQLHWEKW